MSDTLVSPEPSPGPPASSRWLSTFRALRHYNYRLYFLGQLISLLGTWMQGTAMTWLAYQLTGQSFWAGLVLAGQVLPTFLLGIWGGSLADRWPRQRVIFASQATLLVLALILAVLTLARLVQPWHLLLVSLGNGLVTALDLPARLAFVHDLVGPDDLINAVGLNSLLFNAARAIGPALGALAIPTMGAGLCFLSNAVSYIAVLIALALMDRARLSGPGSPSALLAVQGVNGPLASGTVEEYAKRPERRHNLAEQIAAPLRKGFHYLGARPGLQLLLILVGFQALFGWPVLTLLPALSDQNLEGGAADYGFLLSAIGVGALLASLVVASSGSRSRSWPYLVVGVALAGMGELCLSQSRTMLQAQSCCVLVGSGLVLVFATAQSVMQLSLQHHNRGVIMGIWSAVLSGAQQLGSLAAGWWADLWGVPVVLLIQGAGSLIIGGLVLTLALRFPPEQGKN